MPQMSDEAWYQSKPQREAHFQQVLYPAWQKHNEEKHNSWAIATYNPNYALTYIECRAPGCKWNMTAEN